MNKDEETVLLKAISKYGKSKQVDMAIEEMSELIKALLKERRNENALLSQTQNPIIFLNQITEEIADVEIMLAQLKIIFSADYFVEKIRKEKLERLADRIKNDVPKNMADTFSREVIEKMSPMELEIYRNQPVE